MQLLKLSLCYFEKLKPFSFEKCISKAAKGDNNTIIEQTISQISRGRYRIFNHKCKVQILFKSKKRTVFLTDSIPTDDFWKMISGLGNYERSFQVLQTWFSLKLLKRKNLLTVLKEYQKNYCVSGSQFKNECFYKLYFNSIDKISCEAKKARDHFAVNWIDYESQFKKGSLISDVKQINGLFAYTQKGFLKVICNESLNNKEIVTHQFQSKNYGDQLFILKTVSNCKYYYDGIEIVGDRFKIIEKYDLSSIEGRKKLYVKLKSEKIIH